MCTSTYVLEYTFFYSANPTVVMDQIFIVSNTNYNY